MHPVHDIDALLLLATALAAKRRPAALAEIIAAAELIQSFVPYEAKLREAFARLAGHGLIAAVGEGYALTPEAQKILVAPPKKADLPERLAWAKGKLAAYTAKSAHPTIALTAEEVIAAIAEHRSSGIGAGRNLLMPKPKVEDDRKKRPGQWRKPAAARRHKA